MFGAHASTSWCETEGGWTGNGECFIFSIKPNMEIFHSTGENEHFQMLSCDSLAMGGKQGSYGLELHSDLKSGSYNGSIETFNTIRLPSRSTFEIGHVEVWGLGPVPDEKIERAKNKPRLANWNIRDGKVDMQDLESQCIQTLIP
eukprot:GFUD01005694.1.p1 GENE.GFUD01005694.1~~GFUD01005694.1.p1  ORF type:complete len:160 (-),score=39.02 GFUD01005694.1:173-607(-)